MIQNKFSADMIAKDLNSGYWQVNNNFFFHKGDALRFATSVGSDNITYHFYDHIFDSVIERFQENISEERRKPKGSIHPKT